ncbi:MAG: PilN domain-containing protein [Thiotrichaceae bacterium]|nr:PilN domain-containing protein [Thiotrichaceae bacterium]
MARINLLNWREERRKKIEHDFFIMLGVAAFAGIAIVFAVHLQLNAMVEQQNARNNYLKTEIKKVEKAIAEIKLLEKKKADLLSRMTVIQRLQVNRSDSVHLLDEVVKTLPEGTHLTKMVQKNKLLTFDGVAQSNARVSAYMRNIEHTEWLNNPNLKVISSKKKSKRNEVGYSQFTLTSKQSSPNDKKNDKEG